MLVLVYVVVLVHVGVPMFFYTCDRAQTGKGYRRRMRVRVA